MNYDPNNAPDPLAWLDLDESERMFAVQAYVRTFRIPGGPMHANMLMIVENQIAERNPVATGATVVRLIGEGLSRYDALKCVVAILSVEVYRVLTTKKPFDAKRYAVDLKSATAARWRVGEIG